MCGILGYIGHRDAPHVLLDGLRKLEYRGYDSAGVAVLDKGKVQLRRAVGKLAQLEQLLRQRPVQGRVGLGHTRWATHGAPSTYNAHPHTDPAQRIVVVHNGIISNDKELIKKHDLKPQSKVDSSILPGLFRTVGFKKGIEELKGSFSILAYDTLDNIFYAAKNFTPLCFIKMKEKFIFASMKEMLPDPMHIYATEIPPYSIHKINLTYDQHSSYSFIPRRNKKVLVICSSGIDSTTTAWIYKHLGFEVTLLHFLYGQAAEDAESLCVSRLAKKLGCEVIYHDARPLFREFQNSSVLLNSLSPIKGNQMKDAESTFSYVPNRNAIFAMIAGGIGEKIGCDTVSFGGQQMDSVYPDNNPGFVNKVSDLFPYSLNWNSKIIFTAPLIHLIKHEIVAVGKYLEVPYEDTCPCYYPRINGGKVIYCNECGCCQFRINAFKMVEKYSIKNPEDFIMKYIEPFV